MPRRRRPRSAVPLVLALALAGASCSSEDSAGSGVQELESGSGSGGGSGSGSGSGSASGLDAGSLQDGSDDPLVARGVQEYRAYVQGQLDDLVVVTSTFTDAVRAGDLAAAQEAYAPSRVPWERVEPVAGLVEEFDVAVDARVDDFEGVDDPEFTGWHRLEHLLFDQQSTDGAERFADDLDAQLQTLREQWSDVEVPAAAVPVGASELVEEVSLGKITGEENRYAKTDLWDVDANLEGSQAALDTMRPALEQADPPLMSDIDTSFADLDGLLAPLREGTGWVLYCLEDDQFPSERCDGTTVDTELRDRLAGALARLSEQTSQVAGALGLES